MRKIGFLIMGLLTLKAAGVYSQNINLQNAEIKAINVYTATQKLNNEDVIRVVKDSVITEFDEPTFAKIKDSDFTTGTIEVKVLSRLLPDAPSLSRGFIGLAFRINEDNSKFEAIYLRPTNARAKNQLRRNHSIQYFAYPDFKFQRLREETPEMYESYTDMALNEWITMRIEVAEETATLYINNNEQPSLIINDLKLGRNVKGAIGVFVDVGTEGFFKDLKITNR